MRKALTRIVTLGPRFFELPAIILLSLSTNLLSNLSDATALLTTKGCYTIMFLIAGIAAISISWITANWWDTARDAYQIALSRSNSGEIVDGIGTRAVHAARHSAFIGWWLLLFFFYVCSLCIGLILLIFKL